MLFRGKCLQSVPWLSGRARARVNSRGSRARAHARLKLRRSPKLKFDGPQPHNRGMTGCVRDASIAPESS
jgi:hypothetical protein